MKELKTAFLKNTIYWYTLNHSKRTLLAEEEIYNW
jgi:hypothetical protein